MGIGGGIVNTYRNLLIVFFCTGLWHGASWNFVIWGLWHGLFSLLERTSFGVFLAGRKVFNKVYVFLVVIIGWVFFRAETLPLALAYLKGMFLWNSVGSIPVGMLIGNKFIAVLIVAVLLCGFLQTFMQKYKSNEEKIVEQITWSDNIVLPLILIVCVIFLVSGTYNPFIYFRYK